MQIFILAGLPRYIKGLSNCRELKIGGRVFTVLTKYHKNWEINFTFMDRLRAGEKNRNSNQMLVVNVLPRCLK